VGIQPGQSCDRPPGESSSHSALVGFNNAHLTGDQKYVDAWHTWRRWSTQGRPGPNGQMVSMYNEQGWYGGSRSWSIGMEVWYWSMKCEDMNDCNKMDPDSSRAGSERGVSRAALTRDIQIVQRGSMPSETTMFPLRSGWRTTGST
jgi:hypothetical protein